MTAARRLGGIGALVVGVGVFISFPTLGLIEAVAGVVILRTRGPAVSLLAILSTAVVLGYAVLSLVGEDTSDYRITLPIAIVAALTAAALICARTLSKSARAEAR